MAKCKFCGTPITWQRTPEKRWIPLNGEGKRHQCVNKAQLLLAQYMRKVQVRCPECKKFLYEQDVEFLNIEEDIQGRDVLTFTCPLCHKTQSSHRLG